MRALKLMADYDSYPLWEASPGEVGNVDPGDLPLSESLRADLLAWADVYDATLNRDDPRRSGFTDDQRRERFIAERERLAQHLRAELGPDYTIVVQA